MVASSIMPENFFSSVKTDVQIALATWTHHYLRDAELQTALLPKKVVTNKKPMVKPEHW